MRRSKLSKASEEVPLLSMLLRLDTPEDIAFLNVLIQHEIIYRILRTPQAERLRAIATRGDLSHRTARAIAWLRTNYTKPVRVEELAGVTRNWRHQFRAFTAMSPLQYQKQLRLQAARQRIGQPPIRYIKAWRDGKLAATNAA